MRMMLQTRVLLTGAVWLLGAAGVRAEAGSDWITSPSLGWFSPSLHFNGAVGHSSADHVEDLAVGHHDPTREDGTVQGLELGVSLRAPRHVEGFATYNLHYGASEEWEGEWEEAFLKLVDLPGGLEIRGGRLLARYGAWNATHLHGWDFVDLPLPAGLLLGEDGLGLDGGDVTWMLRERLVTYGVVLGYGDVRVHDHGHGADHAEDHDEDHAHHEEDHADHGADHAHDDDAHAHGWEDSVGYGRMFAVYQPHDFSQWTFGASAALGDNETDETRGVYGLDLAYQWRENGLEPGGRALRWTTELFVKSEKAAHAEEAHAEAHDEHDHAGEEHHDDHLDHDHDDDHADSLERESQFGAYTQLIYSWNVQWDTGLRLEYVEGGAHGFDRYRVSPVLTYRPVQAPGVAMRLQYNLDDAHTQEHTVWAQLGLSWGGAEVR